MITFGVDLASQARDTAIALIDWSDGRSRAARVVVGADDEMILEGAERAHAVGIAAPFGWPDPFFEVLAQHREGRIEDPRRAATVSGRDEIMYRTTERRVREWLGLKLMSSTSNMLGTTVLRCAGLLSRLQEAGVEVSKVGGGRVVEVYPPASLMAWGLHEKGYKAQSAVRAHILEQVARRISLDLGGYLSLCVESDDAIDALIAAMTARAVALGHWRQPIDDEERTHAATEGWICVPNGTVWSLVGAPPSVADETAAPSIDDPALSLPFAENFEPEPAPIPGIPFNPAPKWNPAAAWSPTPGWSEDPEQEGRSEIDSFGPNND